MAVDEALFEDLVVLSTEELGLQFDELAEMAASQPEDELVFASLSRVVQETSARGEVQMVMQMAMTLGAMACLEPHFEDIANQAEAAATNSPSDHDGHGHTEDEARKDNHDRSKCKNCQTGKACSYRSK